MVSAGIFTTAFFSIKKILKVLKKRKQDFI